jgi:hypothetical protein
MFDLGDFGRGVTLSIGAQSINVSVRVPKVFFFGGGGQEVALLGRVGVIISVL